MNNLTSLALVLALSQLFSQRTTENEDVGVGTGGGAGQGRSKGQGSNMAGMMGMGLLGTGLMAGMRGSSSLLPNLLGGLTGGRGGRSSMMGRLGGMAGGMRGRSGRMEQGFDMDMPSMQESRQGKRFGSPRSLSIWYWPCRGAVVIVPRCPENWRSSCRTSCPVSLS